jgi:hypothetical protein
MTARLGGRRWRVAILAVVVLLAGCSGAGPAGGDGGAGASLESGVDAEPSGGGGSAAGDQAAGASGLGGGTAAQAQVAGGERALVMRGRASVEVASFDRSAANLTATVEEWGGYVGDREVDNDRIGNRTVTRGRLLFRVPADRFEAFIEAVRTEGDVRRIETNATDVTDRLVDLDARLSNLRAERDRLRTLFDRANDTEDVIVVEERLSEVQGEIERLEARKRALENRVALATVTVELYEPRPEVTRDRQRWYDVGLVAAFLESVGGVATTLRALAVGLAYAAPYLLVFGLPVVGAVAGLLRWRRRRSSDRDGGPASTLPGLDLGDDVEAAASGDRTDADGADTTAAGDGTDADDRSTDPDGEAAPADEAADGTPRDGDADEGDEPSTGTDATEGTRDE